MAGDEGADFKVKYKEDGTVEVEGKAYESLADYFHEREAKMKGEEKKEPATGAA